MSIDEDPLGRDDFRARPELTPSVERPSFGLSELSAAEIVSQYYEVGQHWVKAGEGQPDGTPPPDSGKQT